MYTYLIFLFKFRTIYYLIIYIIVCSMNYKIHLKNNIKSTLNNHISFLDGLTASTT